MIISHVRIFMIISHVRKLLFFKQSTIIWICYIAVEKTAVYNRKIHWFSKILDLFLLSNMIFLTSISPRTNALTSVHSG